MVILPSIRRKYMVNRIPRGATVPMSECVVTLASDSVSYTGGARTVGVTVTWSGEALSVNADYTLSFSNNVNIGPATVTVTGMGQFSGSVTKTFHVVSSGGQVNPWTFDLSMVSDTGKSASLSDGNSELTPYHLQAVNDAMVFFADRGGRRMYLWGFDDGHEYEIDHISQSYLSRSDVMSNCDFGEIAGNGRAVVYSAESYGYVWYRNAGTALDLSSLGAESTAIGGTYYNARIFLSRDGYKLVTKAFNGYMFYLRECATAFDYSSLSNIASYNFSIYNADIKSMAGISSGSPSWNDFQMSHDGKSIVASLKIGDAEVLARIDFDVAWSLNGGTVSSVYVVPSGVSGVQAVMINPQATKMFLFCTGDGKVHEYTLSA